MDRQSLLTFEVLLTNGWVVKLSFLDFQYLIAEPGFPAAKGAAPRFAVEAVPAA